VEALLDRTGGQTPLIDYVASQFESLGYHSWAHRVISSAGHMKVLLYMPLLLHNALAAMRQQCMGQKCGLYLNPD